MVEEAVATAEVSGRDIAGDDATGGLAEHAAPRPWANAS